MNKRILLAAASLALCGSMGLALPAFAQTSSGNAGAHPATATAPNGKTDPAGQHNKKNLNVSPLLHTNMCIRHTGSLIPPPKGQCLPVPGNSYSHRDIERTGMNNIGQALQMLDPSVTIGH